MLLHDIRRSDPRRPRQVPPNAHAAHRDIILGVIIVLTVEAAAGVLATRWIRAAPETPSICIGARVLVAGSSCLPGDIGRRVRPSAGPVEAFPAEWGGTGE